VRQSFIYTLCVPFFGGVSPRPFPDWTVKAWKIDFSAAIVDMVCY
jgi:hypothetical protein